MTKREALPRYELGTPLRLNARAWGIALGLVCGLGLLIATNILVLKGGPLVGLHLRLLGAYLPGYRVTFAGSLLGFGYGLLIGYCAGRLIGTVYNMLVRHDLEAADEDPAPARGRPNERIDRDSAGVGEQERLPRTQ